MKTTKQKLALLVGYVGSEYRGLQSQFRSEIQVPTIEDALFKALHMGGMITDSNAANPHKIGWGRSSRTDKGVHACGLVVSAKLERDLDQSIEDQLSNVNTLLPEDIRIFGGCKVRKGFNPRGVQNFRVYEYLVPSKFIGSKFDKDILKEFVGTFHFHNYTRRVITSSARPLKIDLSDPVLEQFDAVQQAIIRLRYDNYYIRTVNGLSFDEISLGSEKFHRFRIEGVSFLYNQIRKILAVIIGLSHGLYSRSILQHSLLFPNVMPLPVAPALPLLLVYQPGSFWNFRIDEDDLKGLTTETLDACKNYKESVIYEELGRSDFDNPFREFFEELEQVGNFVSQNEKLIEKRYMEFMNSSEERYSRKQVVFEQWKKEIETGRLS